MFTHEDLASLAQQASGAGNGPLAAILFAVSASWEADDLPSLGRTIHGYVKATFPDAVESEAPGRKPVTPDDVEALAHRALHRGGQKYISMLLYSIGSAMRRKRVRGLLAAVEKFWKNAGDNPRTSDEPPADNPFCQFLVQVTPDGVRTALARLVDVSRLTGDHEFSQLLWQVNRLASLGPVATSEAHKLILYMTNDLLLNATLNRLAPEPGRIMAFFADDPPEAPEYLEALGRCLEVCNLPEVATVILAIPGAVRAQRIAGLAGAVRAWQASPEATPRGLAAPPVPPARPDERGPR